MSLTETIKEKLLQARKDRDAATAAVLSVALSEIQLQQGRSAQNGPVTDAQAVKIIQKIISGNEETMAAMTKKLRAENTLLSCLLPQTCSRAAIQLHLVTFAEGIQSAANDGIATGIAMKALASCPGLKDGKLVAEIVREMRKP